MADLSLRIPENVPGPIYVDDTCIYCDLCRETAPTVFHAVREQGWAAVFHQPTTAEELSLVREAIEGCPTESIGSDGDSLPPSVLLNQSLERTSMSMNLKIAAWYLILIAGFGILVTTLHLGPHLAEFEAKSLAYQIGSYCREYTLNAAFLIAGIGILRKFGWARKLGVVLLVISTVYSGASFAWGFSHHRPTPMVLLVSYGIVAAWNGLWIYLLCRNCSPSSLSPFREGLGMNTELDTDTKFEVPPELGKQSPVLDGKRAFWIFSAYFLIQAAFGLVGAITAIIYGNIHGMPAPTLTALLKSGAVLFPFTLVVILFSGAVVFVMVHRSFPGLVRTGVLSPVGWNSSSLRTTLIAGVGGALLACIYHYVATDLFPRSSMQKVGAFTTAVTTTHGWPKMIWAICLLVCPLIEEFLFRGGMLAGFTRSLGTTRAAVIVTTLFVAMHLSETRLYYPAIISITVLALCTLAARQWSNSLIPPICFHTSYNLGIALYAILS